MTHADPRSAPPAGPAIAEPLPRGPVLDWSSWRLGGAADGARSVDQAPHGRLTTSGRAALYHALLQLALPAGRGVLVPTYHCPTMIAPVWLARLTPHYFGLADDGSPQLDAIDDATASACAAMVVPHYFGFARSLAQVRRWCDDRGIALIEDCAHCYFGDAGERPVGAWGDYAIASLSKFFPVSEAGLLVSARRPIPLLPLKQASLGAQMKGWVDVLETASLHRRFAGMGAALALLFRLKNGRPVQAPRADRPAPLTPADFMTECDMTRIGQTPLWASRLLHRTLPRGRIVLQRQRNFALYSRRFTAVTGARPLLPGLSTGTAPVAPYVFPLWVDDADTVYGAVRALRLPVFRWDRVWPGTPSLPGDCGPLWSRHVLQLLCHQDLDAADVEHTASAILQLLKRPTVAPMPVLQTAVCA